MKEEYVGGQAAHTSSGKRSMKEAYVVASKTETFLERRTKWAQTHRPKRHGGGFKLSVTISYRTSKLNIPTPVFIHSWKHLEYQPNSCISSLDSCHIGLDRVLLPYLAARPKSSTWICNNVMRWTCMQTVREAIRLPKVELKHVRILPVQREIFALLATEFRGEKHTYSGLEVCVDREPNCSLARHLPLT